MALPKPLITFLLIAARARHPDLQPDVGQTGLLSVLWGAMLFFCGPAIFSGWASVAGG